MHYAHKKVGGFLFVAVISDDRQLTHDELDEIFALFGPYYFNISEGVWGNCQSSCLEAFKQKGWVVGGRAKIVLDYLAEYGRLRSQVKSAKAMGIDANK